MEVSKGKAIVTQLLLPKVNVILNEKKRKKSVLLLAPSLDFESNNMATDFQVSREDERGPAINIEIGFRVPGGKI